MARAKTSYSRKALESSMWLEYVEGDEVMMFGTSATVDLEYWDRGNKSAALQLAIVKRRDSVRVGMVDTANMEIMT